MASFNDTQRVYTLRWRCRRGMKELDVLLTRYLERDYYTAPLPQRQAFEALLEKPDPEILDYILGREIPESRELALVIAQLSIAGD
ncbi:MAG: succinate dehydrogenase assembly factor 2 [Candidatus Obscuribacterales bacterium]|nr:succinate dehydrogenase assembly factor 2 [Steroidobacteraceae bacterium]